MKDTDRFLIGIVGGIVLLVSVAFAVALLRPKPAYQSDDTPEGAAHNYLFALKQGDYERAYGYLSPDLNGYPNSAEAFEETVRDYRWNFGLDDDSTTLEVTSARRIADERAIVSVRERRFYQNGLFGSNAYTNTFEMTLSSAAGRWKIVTADSYWAQCWEESAGCR